MTSPNDPRDDDDRLTTRATNPDAGVRRAGMGIGTGSTAVDQVELERARAGLPSRDDEQGTTPRIPTELAATARRDDGSVAADEGEVTPNEAHRERLSH